MRIADNRPWLTLFTLLAGALALGCGDSATVGPPGDRDGDGVADVDELAGWDIIIDGAGYGVDADASFLDRRHVTSDPALADTDGDGLDDAAERVARTDPRAADTDGDGLSDGDEVHRYQSNPSTVDSDGDARLGAGVPLAALFDGAELAAGTSPTLADTDGDGASDHEERDEPNRSPLIAEIPRAQLSVAGLVTIEMNVEYSDTTLSERTYGKDFSTTTASRTSRSDTESTAVTIAASSGGEGFFDDLEFSKEGAIRFFGGKALELGRQASCDFIQEGQVNIGPIHFDLDDPEQVGTAVAAIGSLAKDIFGAVNFLDDAGGCDPATPETTTTTSTTLTTESSQEATEAYSEYVTDSQSHTQTTSSGTISVGLAVKNVGPSTFDLKNPSVTLMQWQASPSPDAIYGAGAFRTLATLAVTDGGVLDANGNRTFTLGPNDETVIQVANDDVNPEFIKSLLARPQAMFFAPASFRVSDIAGADYEYLTQNTITRTAALVIDDGVHDPARYQVATNVARTADGALAGVNLGEVLSDVLEIPYETAMVSRRGADGAEIMVDELASLGGLANQRSANRGQPEAGIPGDPQGFWIVYVKRADQAAPGLAFADITLLPGDEVRMIYARDEDGDGLMRREELVYGTDDTLADSDGDGLTDFVEAKVGWNVDVAYTTANGAGVASYRVASDPTQADADGDGLSDADERLGGTDPSNPDTDDDGLRDPCEAAPTDADDAEVAVGSRCAPTARVLYVATGAVLNAYTIDTASGALTALPGSPVSAESGGVADVAIAPDGAHAWTAAGSSGGVPVAAWDVTESGLPSYSPFTQLASGSSGLKNYASLATSIDGTWVFATDEGPDNDKLLVYSTTGGQPGQLTQVQRLRNPLFRPSLVVAGPLGRFVVAGSRNDDRIHVLGFTGDAEAPLEFLVSLDTAANHRAFAFSPDGAWLYATQINTAAVYVYAVGEDGGLSEIAGSPFATGQDPRALVVSPDGGFVYVGNGTDKTLSVLAVTPGTGTLGCVDLDGDPLNGPTDLALPGVTNRLVTDAAGTLLFAATDGGVQVIGLDRVTGTPTNLGTPVGGKALSAAVLGELR